MQPTTDVERSAAPQTLAQNTFTPSPQTCSPAHHVNNSSSPSSAVHPHQFYAVHGSNGASRTALTSAKPVTPSPACQVRINSASSRRLPLPPSQPRVTHIQGFLPSAPLPPPIPSAVQHHFRHNDNPRRKTTGRSTSKSNTDYQPLWNITWFSNSDNYS